MHLQVVMQDPKSGQLKKAEAWGPPQRWQSLAEQAAKEIQENK
jgi:hypothetical protein